VRQLNKRVSNDFCAMFVVASSIVVLAVAVVVVVAGDAWRGHGNENRKNC